MGTRDRVCNNCFEQQTRFLRATRASSERRSKRIHAPPPASSGKPSVPTADVVAGARVANAAAKLVKATAQSTSSAASHDRAAAGSDEGAAGGAPSERRSARDGRAETSGWQADAGTGPSLPSSAPTRRVAAAPDASGGTAASRELLDVLGPASRISLLRERSNDISWGALRAKLPEGVQLASAGAHMPPPPLFAPPQTLAHAEARDGMVRWAQTRLLQTAAAVVATSPLLAGEHGRHWTVLLSALAWRCIATAVPHVARGDHNDARVIIKIKAVRGGPKGSEEAALTLARAMGMGPAMQSVLEPAGESTPRRDATRRCQHAGGDSESKEGKVDGSDYAAPAGAHGPSRRRAMALGLLLRQDGWPGASEVVRGVVFRKSPPMKRTPTDLRQPRVLLVDDALAFGAGGSSGAEMARGAGRDASGAGGDGAAHGTEDGVGASTSGGGMDGSGDGDAGGYAGDRGAGGVTTRMQAVLQQEATFSEMLALKISSLGPTLVLCSQTIAQPVLETLFHNGIVAVPFVKRSVLGRVSRATGAAIVQSLNHIDKMNPAKIIGRARRFRIHTLSLVPDETPMPAMRDAGDVGLGGVAGLHPGEGSTGVTRAITARARALRASQTTVMCVEAEPGQQACTAILRGGTASLKSAKAALRYLISVAYTAVCEACCLLDLGLADAAVAQTVLSKHFARIGSPVQTRHQLPRPGPSTPTALPPATISQQPPRASSIAVSEARFPELPAREEATAVGEPGDVADSLPSGHHPIAASAGVAASIAERPPPQPGIASPAVSQAANGPLGRSGALQQLASAGLWPPSASLAPMDSFGEASTEMQPGPSAAEAEVSSVAMMRLESALMAILPFALFSPRLAIGTARSLAAAATSRSVLRENRSVLSQEQFSMAVAALTAAMPARTRALMTCCRSLLPASVPRLAAELGLKASVPEVAWGEGTGGDAVSTVLDEATTQVKALADASASASVGSIIHASRSPADNSIVVMALPHWLLGRSTSPATDGWRRSMRLAMRCLAGIETSVVEGMLRAYAPRLSGNGAHESPRAVISGALGQAKLDGSGCLPVLSKAAVDALHFGSGLPNPRLIAGDAVGDALHAVGAGPPHPAVEEALVAAEGRLAHSRSRRHRDALEGGGHVLLDTFAELSKEELPADVPGIAFDEPHEVLAIAETLTIVAQQRQKHPTLACMPRWRVVRAHGEGDMSLGEYLTQIALTPTQAVPVDDVDDDDTSFVGADSVFGITTASSNPFAPIRTVVTTHVTRAWWLGSGRLELRIGHVNTALNIVDFLPGPVPAPSQLALLAGAPRRPAGVDSPQYGGAAASATPDVSPPRSSRHQKTDKDRAAPAAVSSSGPSGRGRNQGPLPGGPGPSAAPETSAATRLPMSQVSDLDMLCFGVSPGRAQRPNIISRGALQLSFTRFVEMMLCNKSLASFLPATGGRPMPRVAKVARVFARNGFAAEFRFVPVTVLEVVTRRHMPRATSWVMQERANRIAAVRAEARTAFVGQMGRYNRCCEALGVDQASLLASVMPGSVRSTPESSADGASARGKDHSAAIAEPSSRGGCPPDVLPPKPLAPELCESPAATGGSASGTGSRVSHDDRAAGVDTPSSRGLGARMSEPSLLHDGLSPRLHPGAQVTTSEDLIATAVELAGEVAEASRKAAEFASREADKLECSARLELVDALSITTLGWAWVTRAYAAEERLAQLELFIDKVFGDGSRPVVGAHVSTLLPAASAGTGVSTGMAQRISLGQSSSTSSAGPTAPIGAVGNDPRRRSGHVLRPLLPTHMRSQSGDVSTPLGHSQCGSDLETPGSGGPVHRRDSSDSHMDVTAVQGHSVGGTDTLSSLGDNRVGMSPRRRSSDSRRASKDAGVKLAPPPLAGSSSASSAQCRVPGSATSEAVVTSTPTVGAGIGSRAAAGRSTSRALPAEWMTRPAWAAAADTSPSARNVSGAVSPSSDVDGSAVTGSEPDGRPSTTVAVSPGGGSAGRRASTPAGGAARKVASARTASSDTALERVAPVIPRHPSDRQQQPSSAAGTDMRPAVQPPSNLLPGAQMLLSSQAADFGLAAGVDGTFAPMNPSVSATVIAHALLSGVYWDSLQAGIQSISDRTAATAVPEQAIEANADAAVTDAAVSAARPRLRSPPSASGGRLGAGKPASATKDPSGEEDVGGGKPARAVSALPFQRSSLDVADAATEAMRRRNDGQGITPSTPSKSTQRPTQQAATHLTPGRAMYAPRLHPELQVENGELEQRHRTSSLSEDFLCPTPESRATNWDKLHSGMTWAALAASASTSGDAHAAASSSSRVHASGIDARSQSTAVTSARRPESGCMGQSRAAATPSQKRLRPIAERQTPETPDWEAINQRSIACIAEFKALALPLSTRFHADRAGPLGGDAKLLSRIGPVRVSTTASSTEAGVMVARGDVADDELAEHVTSGANDAVASAVAASSLAGRRGKGPSTGGNGRQRSGGGRAGSTTASPGGPPDLRNLAFHRDSRYPSDTGAGSDGKVADGSSPSAAAHLEVLRSSSRRAAEFASTGMVRSSTAGKQDADIFAQTASRDAAASGSAQGGRDKTKKPTAYDRRRASTRKTLRALRGRLSDVVALNVSMSAGASSGRLVRAQTLSSADLLSGGPLSPSVASPVRAAHLSSQTIVQAAPEAPLAGTMASAETAAGSFHGANDAAPVLPADSDLGAPPSAPPPQIAFVPASAPQPHLLPSPTVAEPRQVDIPGLHPGVSDVKSVFDPTHERWTRGCFGKVLAQTPEEILLGHDGHDVVVTSNGQGRDGHAQLKVTCLWATHFHALRQLCLGSQRAFVESMAMSHGWSTSGGKSGSTFERSDDRRFVIKQVSRSEFQAFTRNSLAYFDHMREVMCGNIDTREAVLLDGSSSGPHIIRRRRPSFLLRIVGAYEVSVTFTPSPRDSQGVLLPRPPPKRSYQRNVFVMENLWYGTEVPDGLKFDLKGLARNMTSKQDDVQATITKAKQTESQRAHQAAQAEGDPAGTGALPETASAAGGGSPGTAAQGTIKSGTVLLDSDFQSITEGQPIAVTGELQVVLVSGL